MLQHVELQVLAGDGRERTKDTLETLLTRMSSFVHFQGIPIIEDAGTFFAGQRACVCVLFLHMCLKIYLATGCRLAKLALPLWLFASVTLPVKHHTPLLGEPNMADITLIWLLPSVNITLVSFQMSLQRGSIRALLALKRLLTGVYSNVLLDTRELNCGIVTVGIGTLVWSLC